MDYENDAEKALQRVCEEFKMPEWTVTVHPCYGAFEDDDGVWAQFDGATGRLQGDRKVKRARVDLLTSAAKLARAIADYGPDFVVGFGQGGIVAGILRWPLVLEVVLQARNLQRKEAQEICLAWARVKAIWAVAPRWWRTKPEAGLLKAACPELALEFPVEPIKGYASVPKRTVKDQACRRLGGSIVRIWLVWPRRRIERCGSTTGSVPAESVPTSSAGARRASDERRNML